jgi:drug/metabolite transporter (DMT)-like permease
MVPALLATLLFATSSVAARRSIQHLGSANASMVRILLASTVLGIYAHLWGAGLGGVALPWFVLSGFIGFGICDTALFLALPMLGAQLASLMVQCLAAPIATLMEWIWLGTKIDSPKLMAGGLILAGVAIALIPGRGASPHPPLTPRAILLGVIAAAGQGIGAVLSRHGQMIARDSGHPVDGLSVAYQRILAGVAFTFVWWAWQRSRQQPPVSNRNGATSAAPAGLPWRRAWPWVVVNGLSGPCLGVACYQWAFQIHPTGVVMSITALTPLVVIPISWAIEGVRPTVRGILGGLIAVSGVIWMALHR